MVDLVNKTRAAMSVEFRFDVDARDEVAHQAAVESMVLLKNDDILPVAANAKIAVHRRIAHPALPGRRLVPHHPNQDDG